MELTQFEFRYMNDLFEHIDDEYKELLFIKEDWRSV